MLLSCILCMVCVLRSLHQYGVLFRSEWFNYWASREKANVTAFIYAKRDGALFAQPPPNLSSTVLLVQSYTVCDIQNGRHVTCICRCVASFVKTEGEGEGAIKCSRRIARTRGGVQGRHITRQRSPRASC